MAPARHQAYPRTMADTAAPTAARRADSVFPALLRYWRQQRGMSQLDLGLTAEVSARHISFLERGRSQPSIEMVSLLAETLDVPLRDRNELLRGAGFSPRYPEPTMDEVLNGPLGDVVDTMLDHHEPFPMLLIDRLYNVMRSNTAGEQFLAIAGAHDAVGTNLMKLLFEDALRELIVNWGDFAGDLLRRVQRESMHHPNDEALAQLLDDLLATPNIPDDWRTPNLLLGDDPMLTVRAKLGDIELAMLATVTTFNAPSNVTLNELRLERYLPLDEVTRQFFVDLAG